MSMSKTNKSSGVNRKILEELENRFNQMYEFVTKDQKLTFQKFAIFVLNTDVNRTFALSMKEVILKARNKSF